MSFFKKEKVIHTELPKHLAIIMDGNGRWAQRRGLPRKAGHAAGAETFRRIATYCKDIGIKNLTVYAFSTENWKRPADEVEAIMKLFEKYLIEAKEKLAVEGIHLRIIGDQSVLSDNLKELIKQTSAINADNYKMICNLAVNYGGRAEIIYAVNKLIESGKTSISEQDISATIYTSDQPEPDLIIRTGGEVRTSNFLMWQSAYSELYFIDVLWPNLKKHHIDRAIEEFGRRNRRYGGI